VQSTPSRSVFPNNAPLPQNLFTTVLRKLLPQKRRFSRAIINDFTFRLQQFTVKISVVELSACTFGTEL
jgi:hypothetical protein